MRLALLNSRKPLLIDPDAPWLRLTYRLAAAAARRGDIVLGFPGPLASEVALFGALQAGGRAEVVLERPDDRAHFLEGLPEVLGVSPGSALEVAPEISFEWLTVGGRLPPGVRDQWVVERADLAVAVAVRPGGLLEGLLRARRAAGRPVVVVAPELAGAGSEGNRRLIADGFTTASPALWDASGALPMEGDASLATPPDRPQTSLERVPRWQDAPLVRPVLFHFTRACPGPWPGQSRWEYLEQLRGGGPSGRREAHATLSRILGTQRLIASGRLIRGGFPVVCFTECALEQLAPLHRYRRHLLRWDFEPYGLALDRAWLEAQGARPVRYLPASQFPSLPESERPWFQRHEPPGCDFTAELEWRLQGDLDLSTLPNDAIRVIAPEHR